MSDATWVIQISPKLADGTLINIRAENPEQLDSLLKWVTTNAQQIVAVPAALGATSVAQTAGLTSVQSAPQQSYQAPAVASATAGNAPTCQHGAMTARSGTNSRGPWSGWFCPTPKGTVGQCDPIFNR